MAVAGVAFDLIVWLSVYGKVSCRVQGLVVRACRCHYEIRMRLAFDAAPGH
jgi:hypothetical protein